MKKIRGILIAIGVIAIVIILAILIGRISQTTFGYTTLSVSNVEIVGDGDFIRVYGVARGGEAITVNLDKDDVNSFLKQQGYEATEDLQLRITMNDPVRRFNIQRKDSQIFETIAYYDKGIFQSCENAKPSGIDGTPNKATATLCFVGIPYGINSEFSGSYTDDTPVTFTYNGESKTLNPSDGINSVSLASGDIQVKWAGNLVGTQGLNTPNYDVLFQNSQYLYLISDGTYNRIQDALVLAIQDSKFAITSSQYRQIFDTYNNRFFDEIRAKTTEYENQINSNTRFTSSGMEVDLESATTFPTFTMTINADEIGLVLLEGKPDITSCAEDTKIFSGEQYSTSISVKNVGQEDGNFVVSTVCSGDSGVTADSTERLVRKGSTESIPLIFRGTNTNDGIQRNNCRITVTDENSRQSDSCNVNIDVEFQPNIICFPEGKQTCRDSSLITCVDGGQREEEFVCDEGCEVTTDGAKCINQVPEVCAWWQEPYTKNKITLASVLSFGIIEPDQESGCKTASWLVWVMVLSTIIALIVIILLLFKSQISKLLKSGGLLN